jgi:mannosyltransferase
MKKSRWLLIAILVGGAVLRSINLQSRGIQYDDAFSILLAQRSLPQIIQGTAADTMPPLYYLLLHYWLRLSGAVWFIRLLSLIFSEICVYLAYLVVRRLTDESAALMTALFVALSPLQIYHAQDIRMYSLLVCCQMAYLYFFIRTFMTRPGKGPGWLDGLGLILCGAAAMYSHNLAIFGLIVPDAYLLLKKNWKKLGWLMAAQGVIIALYLPWLFFLPGQLQKIQSAFWTPKPGLVEILQAVIMFHANLPLPGFWLIVAAVISLQALVMIAIEILRRRKNLDPELAYLFLLAGLPPILLFVISYLMRPVFVPRGFLVAEIGYAGLAGWAASREGRRSIGWAIVALFVVAAIVTLPYQQNYNEFPRSPFQQADDYLLQNMPAGGQTLHDNKLSFFPMKFFAPGLNQAYLADPAGSQNDTLAPATQVALDLPASAEISQAVQLNEPLFFIIFKETLQEYSQQSQAPYPPLAWLDAHMSAVGETDMGDIRIFHFVPQAH